MSKARSLIVFGLVAFAGQVARGQTPMVVSYSTDANPSVATTIIPVVPDGYVMTEFFGWTT